MANQEYQVRITAETRQAKDRIEAVQNSINALTDKQNIIRVGVDANAARRTAEHTQEIANNIRKTTQSIREGSGLNIVSGASLSSAASLASQFYGIRRDVKGLNQDLGKALGATNVSEFMRTEQFLERVLENSRSRSKEIVETYSNIRELPGAASVLGPVENYARAQAWQQFGDQIAQQTLQGVQAGLQQGVVETKRFFYGEVFEDIARGTNATIDTLARLGLAIQGVQLLLGPLAAAWGAAFNQIIGQNVRLQEVILSTQTTLASTGRVIDNNTGKELLDPLQKINALGDDVQKAISNIRVRSLDLAGVTSQQIIDIFGVVATSISQVNGNIKDAEDLAISFTAALGTLGIPFYQARQEIGSILGGYITEDSLLAKRLQISNSDINRARSSIDGVVGYLQKKLQVAVAGQAISAKSFSGVLSNIQEVFENIAQRIGEPLLSPIVGGLTTIYNFMKDIQGVVVEVGAYLARTFVSTINSIVNIFKQSDLIRGIGASITAVSKPFREFARALELGLSGSGLGVIDSWVTGLEKIPRAFDGLINGLIKLGNFLKLQIELITQPVLQLLDQTRERLGGVLGAVQGFARLPQFLLFEGPDALTKGWDTIASTIQYAAQSLSKFAVALVQLKITEFTAKLRAAATVFELFGSLVLGKLNLALSFFDFLGNVAASDLAKFTVSLLAINRLINNTEFFGLKGLFQFLAVQRPIFLQFIQDIGLFAKGFKDAGNIDRYVKSLQEAQTKLLQTQKLSTDPVVANTANLRILTKELNDLRAAQIAAVKAQADPGLISKQAEQIKALNTQLREANTLQRQFTLGQRASAAARLAAGTGETAAAQEALRQAGIVTSGAAAAKAVSSALDTLGTKIGLTREQMKGLGGAFNVAAKSVQTFITASLAINIGFAALSLAIAGVMSWMQQLEEAEKRRQTEAYRTSQVNKILSSSYEGLRRAAAGGDIAAQRRLEEDREAANAAFQLQQEKKAKLIEEDVKLNERLYEARKELERNSKNQLITGLGMGSLMSPDLGGDVTIDRERAIAGIQANINNIEKQRLANKQKIAEADKRIYEINLAQAKVSEVESQQNQFTLIAERRRDIEKRIQETRKDYIKEITDKEFQARIEVLNLEQQKRREIQEKELSALRERFSLLANNATQQDQRIITLVQNYEQALLEAANAEGARRSELVIKEQQLRKEIEDYAFKMAKEKANLEKQIGNYQKEVEKWKTRQTRIRAQEELTALRQRKTLEGVYFQPYNTEQQQRFTNAAQQQGLSTPDAYALLQLFPKTALGVSGTEDVNVIMARLKRVLDMRSGYGLRTDPVGVAEGFGYQDPEGLASKLRAEAISSLNLNRFFVKQDQEDLRNPDLNIDWEGMQKRLRAYNQTIIEATKQLQAAQAENDQVKIREALRRFADPSIYSDVKADYKSEVNRASMQLALVLQSIQSEAQGVASLQSELDALSQRLGDTLRTTLKSMTGLERLPEEVINSIVVGAKMYGLADADPTYQLLQNAGVSGEALRRSHALIGQSLRGYEAARQNVMTSYPERQTLRVTEQLSGLASSIESKILESFSSRYSDSFNRLNEALSRSTDESYSLAKAQESVRREVSLFMTTELAKIKGAITPEQLRGIQEAAAKYESTLLSQVNTFDQFNKALEAYTKRLSLAQGLTDAIANNTRTLLSDILMGQRSIADAFSSFAESLNKELAGMFIDSIIETYKKQLFEQIKNTLGVPNLEDQARQALATAGTDLKTAATSHQSAATALSSAASSLASAATAITNATTGAGSVPTANPSANPDDPNSPTGKAGEVVKKGIGEPAKEVGKWLKSLSNIVAAAIPVITGFGLAMSGVQQIKKGGTYNTLMGLASIFGSLSSFTGMFGKGGIFGGARALGGPVLSHTPYLVGERGPELFMPNSSGRIIPNDRTAALFQDTRAALAAQRSNASESATSTPPSAAMRPIEVRSETQVINNVEYVTAEQHRKGLQEAARRGQMLAYQGIQHSVKVRRRLGF